MNVLQGYVLFVLPSVILVGSLIGIFLLKKEKAVNSSAKKEAEVSYDFSNVIRHPAVGE